MAKILLCLGVVALVALAAAAPKPEEKFTTKYDNVNIDEILANKRLLNNYLNCILDKPKARCTNDALELKKSIPDALTNECMKCSEKQKELSEKVVRHLAEKEKESWEEVKAKFDPTGIYEKRYEKIAQEKGVAV
ncbi:ejaculatory bulb-specific protein 3 [Frankliniella occidentalis]|uniref:Ejaculatory bulb-specific protein 3 n=1 Tax=Frankliniella occidentalis TaxID=133901 RepID=A0A6J1SFU6_FRAOC|nr:ejaculatory bulb-specific protein 3 [Frankliniella occidentalis]